MNVGFRPKHVSPCAVTSESIFSPQLSWALTSGWVMANDIAWPQVETRLYRASGFLPVGSLMDLWKTSKAHNISATLNKIWNSFQQHWQRDAPQQGVVGSRFPSLWVHQWSPQKVWETTANCRTLWRPPRARTPASARKDKVTMGVISLLFQSLAPQYPMYYPMSSSSNRENCMFISSPNDQWWRKYGPHLVCCWVVFRGECESCSPYMDRLGYQTHTLGF